MHKKCLEHVPIFHFGHIHIKKLIPYISQIPMAKNVETKSWNKIISVLLDTMSYSMPMIYSYWKYPFKTSYLLYIKRYFCKN
jgi:hypothetical protein